MAETPETLKRAMARNYALAHDLITVVGWIAAHTLPNEKPEPELAILRRAITHLRGESREPVQRIDELLRNDPWAAAIAGHVRAALTSRVEALEVENERLKAPIPCGVCGGRPLASGRPCVCGGVGTEPAEMQGLREMAFELEESLARLTEENQRLRAERPTYCGTCLSFEQRATLGLIGHYLTGGEDGLPLDWNAMLYAAKAVADARRAARSSPGEPANG